MSWSWRFETASGALVDPGEVGGAEIWRDLADRGVGQVYLLEDGREVYGPMSLSSAE
jgi:hypothetical protein